MRLLIISLLFFWGSSIYCQDLFFYKDTLYHFSIGIPVGWRYGKPKNYPDLLLISIRQSTDTTEKIVENFNVTFVQQPNSTLDTVFNRLIRYNSLAEDYSVVEKGSKKINEQDFMWVISTHLNQYNGQVVYNYDFITYDGTKAYILTMFSTSENFKKYRTLFDKIAQTFQVKILNQ